MVDPALAMLHGLVGEWRGFGTVRMPTMAAIDFDEVVRFSRRDERSLDYWQRAQRADGSGELLHSEAGIWRLGSEGRLELSIALPGSTEISEGAVIDGELSAESTSIGRAATSLRFVRARRHFRLTGDTLAYDSELESTSFSMAAHVTAVLGRVAVAPATPTVRRRAGP